MNPPDAGMGRGAETMSCQATRGVRREWAVAHDPAPRSGNAADRVSDREVLAESNTLGVPLRKELRP